MQQENGGESCVASSWFCNVKCTSVLAKTEKNAHTRTQSNAVSFAVTIFLSGLPESELRLFKNPSQSVCQEKIDKIAVP